MGNQKILDAALSHPRDARGYAADIVSKDEMKDCKDEVLRRIGRNLLLFQQIEGVVKFLVANGSIDGPASTLLAQHEQRAASIQKQTLGQLIGKLTNDFLSDADDDMETPEPMQEDWMKFTFKRRGDGAFNEQQKIDLATVLAERNELIHHFLSRYNVQSLDSTREVMQYLDEQREKVLPVFERLKSMMNSQREFQCILAALLESDEFEKYFEPSWLQSSPLVIRLADLARQKARPDGWLPLAMVGHQLWLHAHDEMSSLKERYGFSSLKKLVIATGLFDVQDEPTINGGTRTVYRIRNA